MDVEGAADAWRRIPAPARWIVTYAAALGASAGLGALTIGAGNAVFLAGAFAVFLSLAFIRLGGPKAVVGRDRKGAPQFALDREKRRFEIGLGVRIFLLGLALWATVFLANRLGL